MPKNSWHVSLHPAFWWLVSVVGSIKMAISEFTTVDDAYQKPPQNKIDRLMRANYMCFVCVWFLMEQRYNRVFVEQSNPKTLYSHLESQCCNFLTLPLSFSVLHFDFLCLIKKLLSKRLEFLHKKWIIQMLVSFFLFSPAKLIDAEWFSNIWKESIKLRIIYKNESMSHSFHFKFIHTRYWHNIFNSGRKKLDFSYCMLSVA